MSVESMIKHMNQHHQGELLNLAKTFAGVSHVREVSMVNMDTKGIDLLYDNTPLRINFPKEYNHENLKQAIIELCQSIIPKENQEKGIAQEIEGFKNTLRSVIIASLNQKGEVVSSYAPIIHYQDKMYIYISEVAEHYDGLKNNPHNIEILFIEDEARAKTILARERLKYRVVAHFIPRDSEIFNQVLDFFESSSKDENIKIIRNMSDFHLIALQKQEGRYVKGFGKAYRISQTGEITHLGGGGGGHKPPHK